MHLVPKRGIVSAVVLLKRIYFSDGDLKSNAAELMQ